MLVLILRVPCHAHQSGKSISGSRKVHRKRPAQTRDGVESEWVEVVVVAGFARPTHATPSAVPQQHAVVVVAGFDWPTHKFPEIPNLEPFKQFVDKGRTEGLQTSILIQGREKFGVPNVEHEAALKAITDPAQLEALCKKLLHANTWAELLATG